jgi:hypothetical protein
LIDANDHVSGVVSMGDIFKYLLNEGELKSPKKSQRRKSSPDKLRIEMLRVKGKKELTKEKEIMKKYVKEALESDSE